MHRSKMSAEERGNRSRLAQLVHVKPLLRGSLTYRRRGCGKMGCRCQDGKLHESLYLTIAREGKTIQRYVPSTWEKPVQEWVENYKLVRKLLEKIVEVSSRRLKERKEN